jgi:hypothetical protein
MRPHFNFAKLAALPDIEAKRKAIAKAVGFNLHLPQLVIDVLGSKAPYVRAANDGGHVGVKNLSGMPAVKAPTDAEFEAGLRRKYATPDSSPVLTGPLQVVASWYHDNMPEIDTGYLALFDMVDLRGTFHDKFEINTTSLGLTWSQRKPGAPTEIRRSPAENTLDVPYIEYSEGLGILDVWLQFNKFWRVSEAVAEFMATEQDKRAGVHYGLFTALGAGINQAFATDDASTLNAAAAGILRTLRGKGLAIAPNAQFDIVCAPENCGRILAMLDAQRGSPMIAFGTQKQPIAFQIRNVICTTYVPANTGGYYLVLPGRKIKCGMWMDVKLESKRDIYVSAEDWVGRTQYNAAIAEQDQVRRVLFS